MPGFTIFVEGADTEPAKMPVCVVDGEKYASRLCEGMRETEYAMFHFSFEPWTKSDLGKIPAWVEMIEDAQNGVYGEIVAGICNLAERMYLFMGGRRSRDKFTSDADTVASNGGSTTQGTQDAAGGLIDRLIAGPDDAELSQREMAQLEAYLKQPVSLSKIQREKQGTGESETNANRNKLKLIRDFNRNLRAANADSRGPQAKPNRRGRKKADYETVQREAELTGEWERARDSGVYKADFAKDKGMTLKDFDRLLDRVDKRKKASE